jgi:DNA ligase (NAD+)
MSNDQIKLLEDEIKKHNDLYWVKNEPAISDTDYDKLINELTKLDPDNPLIKQVGSGKTTTDKTVVHETPMLSLDKCYSDEEMVKWINNVKSSLIVMPKVDGLAVSLRYGFSGLYLASTRGDGIKGEDATANVRMIKDIPKRPYCPSALDIEIRGEVYMAKSIFDAKYKDHYSNPRNLASGALKQKDPQKTADYELSFMAYDILGTNCKTEIQKMIMLNLMGFTTIHYALCAKENFKVTHDDVLKVIPTLPYEADGIVYKINDLDEQQELGVTTHHPRYAIAYKFKGDKDTTKLVKVEWSMGRNGVLTPLAIVEPIVLSGATVTKASLANVTVMTNLELTEGCEVEMERSGMVIPYVHKKIKDNGGSSIKVPDVCPVCGAKTEIKGVKSDFLFCTAGENCPGATKKYLEHFVKALEIEELGPKTIDELYDSGLIKSPMDFYRLTKEALVAVKGRNGEKIYENLQASRTTTFEKFLYSLSIDGLGRTNSKVLAAMNVDVKNPLKFNLMLAVQLGINTANTITDQLIEKQQEIKDLLSFISFAKVEEKTGKLSGKSVLFTGKMTRVRKDCEQLAKDNGAVLASMNKNLSILVVGAETYADFLRDGTTTEKLKKAVEHNKKGASIEIMCEDKFWEMMS